jgi:hypothetical protein
MVRASGTVESGGAASRPAPRPSDNRESSTDDPVGTLDDTTRIAVGASRMRRAGEGLRISLRKGRYHHSPGGRDAAWSAAVISSSGPGAHRRHQLHPRGEIGKRARPVVTTETRRTPEIARTATKVPVWSGLPYPSSTRRSGPEVATYRESVRSRCLTRNSRISPQGRSQSL